MFQSVERRPTRVDQDTQGKKRRTTDPVLAVDQDLVAFSQPGSDEGNAAVEAIYPKRFHVRRGKMKESQSGLPKAILIVPILLAKVDDGADAVLLGELGGELGREAAANGELVG